jgi:hypothetical protein
MRTSKAAAVAFALTCACARPVAGDPGSSFPTGRDAVPRVATVDVDGVVDARCVPAIDFELLGLVVPLGPHRYLRSSGVVEDLDADQAAVLREMGVDPAAVTFRYTNAAHHGRAFTLQFRNGIRASFIAARRRPDDRLNRACLEHERYHALAGIDESLLGRVHDHVRRLGFDVRWQDLDEERRATIVELLALHRTGVPLESIGGDDAVAAARDLLAAARVAPAAEDGGVRER